MVRIITFGTSTYKNLFEIMIEKAPKHNCFCMPTKHLVYSLTEKTFYNYLLNNNDHEIYNMLDNLIKNSKKVLLDNNFKIVPEQFYIEFQRYNVQGKTTSSFSWHIDDDGPTRYNVCTLIYYLHKSETIIGGNLQFKQFGVLVKPDMAIMFDGNVLHKPDEMDGFGQRDLIVVMFRRDSNT